MNEANKIIGIPRFLYNSSLFSKVLFLLFVNNYEIIPETFWHNFYLMSDVTDYLPPNLRTLAQVKDLELSSLIGAMLARCGTKVLIVDKDRNVS